MPDARFFLRIFDLCVLSSFFMLAVANAPFFLTTGLFFGLLGACRVYRDSFFLRIFSRRLHFTPILVAGLQSLFFGFLSLASFNFFFPANAGDGLEIIIWAAAGCSIPWSFCTAWSPGKMLSFKNRKKPPRLGNLDSAYKELMERFMNLSNRIVSFAGEQRDQDLLDFMSHLQETGVDLIGRGNELFLFLREMKQEAANEKGSAAEVRDGEGLLLQERAEILRQKAILLDELNTEEKNLWGTLENMILRMDNLSLSLIGKKGSFLFDSSSEIGILNRKMEEAVVFLDEKRKAIKLLSDS
jgi:hypothetical protein